MPLYRDAILAPVSSVDNAPVRFDGTPGNVGQSTSTATLDDTGIFILSDLGGAIVVGGTVTSVVVAGVTLTPAALLHTTLGTRPNLVMLRVSGTPGTGATSAPTFNYMRARGSPGAETVVNTGDSLGIFSASGYDGTDYASAAQIDMQVDESSDTGSGVAANKMGGKIRFLVSADGTQNPALALSILKNKEILLAATGLITIPNTGLHLLESSGTDDLIIAPSGTLTADRTLSIIVADGDRTLTLPLYYSLMLVGGANTGTVTTGTPTYMTGGGATASVGVTPARALHLTKMSCNFAVAAATTSGSVTVRFTLFKNANSGTAARVFQVTFTTITTGTGRLGSSTTVVDAGTDAINGTTDYLVLAVEVTASTSCSLTALDVLLEGTLDA